MNSSDCPQIEELLPEFLAGRVSAADESRVREHLQECGECRKRANAVSLLQQTPIPSPDPERWNAFVDGVVQATEEKVSAARPRLLWLALAALVVALSALLFFIR